MADFLGWDWQVSPRNSKYVCRDIGTQNEHGEPIFEPIASLIGVGLNPSKRAKLVAASGRLAKAASDLLGIIRGLPQCSDPHLAELVLRTENVLAEIK